jgi:hypothetical protein
MEVTQALLRAMFDCDPSVGVLVRRFTLGKGIAGKSSTLTDKDGYLIVGVCRKIYRAHRVVWMYFHGSWPNGDIDHINRIKTDNRLSNLRVVTHRENRQNQGPCRNNKSGMRGVYRHYSGKWVAEIYGLGEKHYLGIFDEIADAQRAYASAASFFHTHNPYATQG